MSTAATTLSIAHSPSARSIATAPAADEISKRSRWTGRVLSGIVVAFLLFDATFKVSGAAAAVKGTVELGYPEGVLLPLGILQLICLIAYLVPRTAPIGAILWTGYLGGAIATHVRLGNPLLSHTLFPIYVAALLWGGLYLRDRRIRGLIRKV